MNPLGISEAFKRVYQGGHHDVYCDGESHVRTRGGGFTEMSKPWRIESVFNCDCAEYRREPRS